MGEGDWAISILPIHETRHPAPLKRENHRRRSSCALTEIVKSVEYIASPIAIFFPINQSKLTDMDLINLGTFAEAVKKTGKTYKIMGSADKATGSKKINLKLSQDRAASVYNALVNKFGVNASQLEVIAKGDENEPFDKPVLNRVVILE